MCLSIIIFLDNNNNQSTPINVYLLFGFDQTRNQMFPPLLDSSCYHRSSKWEGGK